MNPPPPRLLRSLVDGPSAVSGVEWHEQVVSTNLLAAQAARRGAPEIHIVCADTQTAGRGRQGRHWTAPAGTSLMASLVLRPRPAPAHHPLLALLAGVALADVADAFLRGAAEVALKWPNDLLVDGRKAAGILLESVGAEAVVVGIGLNVDWRGVSRPAEIAEAVSLAEAAGHAIDRWRVFAALVGVLARRYDQWQEQPTSFLPAYRERCATLGQRVRVMRPSDEPLVGTASAVADDGRLEVTGEVVTSVSAGDVMHLRPVGQG